MTVINNIFRFIFPERETARRVRTATDADIHRRYAPRAVDDCMAIASYRDPLVRALITEIKFHNNERAASLLGTLFTSFLNEQVREPTLIVPMPLHASRLRARGYNQVARVVRYAIAHNTRHVLADNILVRSRKTAAQTSLDKTRRAENLAGAFAVRNQSAASRIQGAHLLLVDDVLTTGATMRAAKAVLLKYQPASIICLAFAH